MVYLHEYFQIFCYFITLVIDENWHGAALVLFFQLAELRQHQLVARAPHHANTLPHRRIPKTLGARPWMGKNTWPIKIWILVGRDANRSIGSPELHWLSQGELDAHHAHVVRLSTEKSHNLSRGWYKHAHWITIILITSKMSEIAQNLCLSRYHYQLKSKWLGGKQNQCINHLIQALIVNMLPNYVAHYHSQMLGFKGPDLAEKQCEQICTQCYDKDLHDWFLFISRVLILESLWLTPLSFYRPLAPLFLLTHAQLAVVTQSCALLYFTAHRDLLLQWRYCSGDTYCSRYSIVLLQYLSQACWLLCSPRLDFFHRTVISTLVAANRLRSQLPLCLIPLKVIHCIVPKWHALVNYFSSETI